MTSDNVRRGSALLPAVLLILVQTASGIRDLPQLAFFVIYLQERLELSPVTISSVVSGAQIAGMLAALLGGAITGRLGSKWVLVGGLAMSGVGSLAFQVSTLWIAAVLWFIGGAGFALVTVSGASYLTHIGKRGALGILAALFALSLTIGGALGNPIAGVIIERSGFGVYSWSIIAVSIAAVLIAGLLMPNVRDHGDEPALIDTPEPAIIPEYADELAYAQSPRPARVTAPKTDAPRAQGGGLIAAARQTNVRFLIGLRSLPTIFYGMLSVLIPLLLNDLSGSKVMVAAFGTTTLVVASVAQLLAGRSADRWGARGPTLVTYAVVILSGFGLALTAGTVWGLFAFGVLGIAAAWALSALMFVWVNDGVARPDHPATFGLLHAMWSVSMITGSVLGGWFVQTIPWLPFLIAGLINVGSLFLILAYYRRVGVAG